MPFLREFVELILRAISVCHACGVQGNVPQTMTRIEWHNDWKVCLHRGTWGMLGLVHQDSKLVDCVRVSVCGFLYVYLYDMFHPKAGWKLSPCFLKLFFLFNFLQEWRRMSSGKDSACACLRKFPFYFLDGFKLIVNCQRKWCLLSMPYFSSNLFEPDSIVVPEANGLGWKSSNSEYGVLLFIAQCL